MLSLCSSEKHVQLRAAHEESSNALPVIRRAVLADDPHGDALPGTLPMQTSSLQLRC